MTWKLKAVKLFYKFFSGSIMCFSINTVFLLYNGCVFGKPRVVRKFNRGFAEFSQGSRGNEMLILTGLKCALRVYVSLIRDIKNVWCNISIQNICSDLIKLIEFMGILSFAGGALWFQDPLLQINPQLCEEDTNPFADIDTKTRNKNDQIDA